MSFMSANSSAWLSLLFKFSVAFFSSVIHQLQIFSLILYVLYIFAGLYVIFFYCFLDFINFFYLFSFSFLSFFKENNYFEFFIRQFVNFNVFGSVIRSLLFSFGGVIFLWFFLIPVALCRCLCIWRISDLFQSLLT